MLAFVICTACMMLTFMRWYILVRAQDLPFTLGDAVRLGFFGSFLNLFLPGSVTGDLAKMVFTWPVPRAGAPWRWPPSSIDRVIGFCGLIWLMALLGAIFWVSGSLEAMVRSEFGRNGSWNSLLASRCCSSLAAWCFGSCSDLFALSTTTHWIARIERIPRLGHSLAELCRATLMYRSCGRAVLASLILAIIGHTGFVLTFYFCSLFVNPGNEVPPVQTHFLIVPVGMTIQAGMPTPGGMGGGELAFGWLYQWVGGEEADGVLAAVIRRLLDLVVVTIGFMVCWRMKPTLHAAAAEQKATAATDVTGLSGGELQKAISGN